MVQQELGIVSRRQFSVARRQEILDSAHLSGMGVCFVSDILVQQDQSWQDSIRGAESSISTHHPVMRNEIGSQYKPVSTGQCLVDIVFLNYQGEGNVLSKALDWASKTRLSPSNPREIFAAVKQHKDTPVESPSCKKLAVVSPIICEYFLGDNVVCVRWGYSDTGNVEVRNILTDLCNTPDYWFGFCEGR